MKEIKGFYNYSSFGNTVSITTHGEIYDNIIIEIPEEIEVYMVEAGTAFRTPDGTPYFFGELFKVKMDDVVAQWYDGRKHHTIICKYRLAT